jgi:citronellol/citronellal dehydrogenase
MTYDSVFRAGLFSGQTMLVTGGGSGIGRCTAHELKSLGARIALVGRTWEKLEQVKQELDDPDTFIFAADLREEDQVKAAVDGVLKWSGRIDGLINNAGGQFPAPLKDISLNGWNAVVRNNMTATFLMSKEVYLRWMEATAARSSMSAPTSSSACRAWATTARRAPARPTSPTPLRSNGPIRACG